MRHPRRSAREVVELYNLVVWNEHDLELAQELFADTVIRHEVGEARTLTREEAVRRVVDGRITEVWNRGYGQGVWA
ncbi:hypothetical protein OG225_16405 [Nocardia sp. NBC_01377]|uniref:hypothetical protein n=1 Tax=Nocardia sp. NBC_01377 TaxID=2903595 RepID=UPI00324325BC